MSVYTCITTTVPSQPVEEVVFPGACSVRVAGPVLIVMLLTAVDMALQITT